MPKLFKIFALSDIHGRRLSLADFEACGFDADNPEHMIVLLGDYFDRYEENVEVLEFCEMLKERFNGRVQLLYGNHDDYLECFIKNVRELEKRNAERLDIDADLLRRWYRNGGEITIHQLFGTIGLSSRLTKQKLVRIERLERFIQDLKPYFETKNIIFTHAGINKDREIDFWDRRLIDLPNPIGKAIVIGHTTFDYALLMNPNLVKVTGPSGIGEIVKNKIEDNLVWMIDNGHGNNIVVFEDELEAL